MTVPFDPATPSRLLHRLNWLTPARCRWIFLLLVMVTFLSNLHYIVAGPLDLSGDEAHYWDWSRQLDWSYYSKGPLVAYVIRASCAIFGDVAWAVRLPAILLAAGTSIITYLLTRKLFGSDRLALGAVVLYGLSPLFNAGSVLMTIDPPFYFCWGLATYLAVLGLFDGKRWVWPVIGAVVGLGFLAKYAMFLWIPMLFVAILLDRRFGDGKTSVEIALHPNASGVRPDSTPRLRDLVILCAIALLFTTPVILWNIKHGGVTALHVAKQMGAGREANASWSSLPEFVGGQIGVLGPLLAAMMIGGIVLAIRHFRQRRRERFLLLLGLPFLAGVTILSFFVKIQLNWPAPAYFTLMILTAHFLGTRMSDQRLWRPWRGWFWAAVILAIILAPLARDLSILYPLAPKWKWREIDPSVRLRGWDALGREVSRELKSLSAGAFVLTDKYQTASELAFYVEGQPKTYYAGSYAKNPRQRDRFSQFDMWADRTLEPDRTTLLGKDCVFVGFLYDDTAAAFERVEQLPERMHKVRGVPVRVFRVWKCYGFKGMKRPEDSEKF